MQFLWLIIKALSWLLENQNHQDAYSTLIEVLEGKDSAQTNVFQMWEAAYLIQRMVHEILNHHDVDSIFQKKN